jgi:DNA-binding MarR family transcriptional regulator
MPPAEPQDDHPVGAVADALPERGRDTDTDVDLSDPEQLQLAVRIGLSWIELRRGAAMSALRDLLFGSGDDALEQGQMDTLDLLAQQPSWRMSELADALRVDPSTATRAVQRLVRSGLAGRSPGDDDGRVVMVTITDAGVSRHADVAERRGRLMAHLLGTYAPDERVQLADLLERFVAAVDSFVSRTTP